MTATIRRLLHPTAKVLDSAKGLVEYVASNETLDSYREVIRVAGWKFDLFEKNAPFVDSHQYDSVQQLLGRVVDFQLTKANGKPALVETVQWAIDVPENSLAMLGFKMTEAGYLKAVSVGFWPTRIASQSENRGEYMQHCAELGLTGANAPRAIYLEQQQVELSACVIGANPDALARSYKAGFLTDDLLEKISAARSLLPRPSAKKPDGALPVVISEEPVKVWFCPHCKSKIGEKTLAGWEDLCSQHTCGGWVEYPPPSEEEQTFLDSISSGKSNRDSASLANDPALARQAAGQARAQFLWTFQKTLRGL